MWTGYGAVVWARRMARLARTTFPLPRRRRPPSRGDTGPAGPTLVAGRGRPRRVSPWPGIARAGVFLALAAGLVLALVYAWGPLGR